ncbi:MAG: hypothetical protein B6229_06285 [Spirochaetaceae bacterium 4572_7]|nr:MAG: hypothetical protein B6229_06285 [Spirochaetaceae bacterium 4572_7]
MKNIKYVLLTTLILFSINVFSADREELRIPSLSLHLRLVEMTTSEKPFIVGEDLIFTYSPSKDRPRHVGIAFKSENFQEIHNLYRNPNGIYFFMYKYPKEKIIDYRFIEDGVWIQDKKNRSTSMDRNFITLSSFSIPDRNIKDYNSPIIGSDSVTFIVKGLENSSVYLTGDFNNWNPFLYKMKEYKPGEFRITLPLPKGKYGYYFIFNGERVLDKDNFDRGISMLGETVSLFTIQ